MVPATIDRTRTYKDRKNPRGIQAVGSAIGKNPVAYLVPCHRVIKKAGQISEYRWGSTQKSAIIGWEASGTE